MGTSCIIGIKNNDGSIEAITCHWDGHPDGVGKTLFYYYNTEEKIRALIALGNISSLGERLAPEPGELHSFNFPKDDITVAYGRDRGEELISYHYPSIEYFKETFNCCDYAYLFEDNTWWYTEDDTTLIKLTEERIS